ncbi:MAG: DUF6673 family protein [Oscillospiraceae bacterium]|nr:DUF6673 family protein [Oscillospiraceae bacterium]
MTITYNGLTLEYDICEAANLRKYNDALKEMERMKASAIGISDPAEIIEKYCGYIFRFIDVLYGEGTHIKLFGDSVNIRKTTEVYRMIIEAIKKESEEFNSDLKSFVNSI